MSTRNLTSRSGNANSSSNSPETTPQELQNPFSQEYELRSFENDSHSDEQQQIFKEPYQNSSSSFSNNNYNMSHSNSSNGLLAPEYDRYPSVANSRIASMNSLNSKASLMHRRNNSDDSTQSSDPSSNPFLVDTDFSPFGGYPASSFPLTIDDKEEDDHIHNPDPIADAEYEKHRFINDMKSMDRKSFWGFFAILALAIGVLLLLILLPLLTYTGVTGHRHQLETYVLLTDYTYPQLSAIRTDLVDPDTPEDAKTRVSKDGDEWTLVFSDEFNIEGRTFYEGEDQYWYGADLHYDATKDLEWYDPDAAITSEGALNIRLDTYRNHNLNYRSAMLHSWNQMCFTQGIIEVSAMLPGYGDISGLWPGIWTLGNLARPGYLATTEGVWPYSYDTCDSGITANQSSADGISFLPGQKLNACTCRGQEHPNRGHGRGAPEIDIVEAAMGDISPTEKVGVVSQSVQLAPFDIWYIPDYEFVEIHNESVTLMNTYAGGPFQQAVSGVTTLNHSWYERAEDPHFQNYAFEYTYGSNGYIRWFVGDDPTFTVHANAFHPDGNIGWRPISTEPMSIIMNLGLSNNWAYIDWPSLNFPVTMKIDYVRVYQPPGAINVGCDPADHPTYDYIQQHSNAYQNVNLTSWKMAGYTFPTTNLTGGC
ncbi:Beta-glucan synthesis-associated protein [Komagataella phaffii CBS 7435]|uniref:Protein required for beta-1,6 glucan biosynthesis n=2 Tax=Komagataella phaffii TaxID=460519 RepID=C4R839_KOMPG|nr:Protein required for beta-1,6 glucan biosynthesis [Komagataella phaffii GS115]AOA64404.1 GQ67_04875T0 [Komagataella phaffii]CAH2450845.1 Beta-glucan synthesis-associated protein [Komagataella phaffii CBS 7435]AOA69472.1 GQ68_04847T0 [Komagataella phaffii GS115]CAY71764.1 Protein required for beta-1,6 glucan biosynthesis [Komagataella phaffii GS115]CCA40635.1 Beta-glucan synthesis-associated protein [Komagataella phaffii CBS 7435]